MPPNTRTNRAEALFCPLGPRTTVRKHFCAASRRARLSASTFPPARPAHDCAQALFCLAAPRESDARHFSASRNRARPSAGTTPPSQAPRRYRRALFRAILPPSPSPKRGSAPRHTDRVDSTNRPKHSQQMFMDGCGSLQCWSHSLHGRVRIAAALELLSSWTGQVTRSNRALSSSIRTVLRPRKPRNSRKRTGNRPVHEVLARNWAGRPLRR